MKSRVFRFGCVVLASLMVLGACPSVSTAADVSWSMVVVADTHAWKAGANFNAMTQWILDNKDARNIKLMVHNGDLTIKNTDAEWKIEKASVRPLDNQVSYILATGNHDYPGKKATTRDATKFNTYFKLADNPLNNSATEGIVTVEYETGKLENTYSTFTAPDGRKMLIFSLEFGPRQQVVDWANSIAADPQYEDHTAVLSTHAYMDLVSKGGRDSSRWNPHNHGVDDIDPTNDPIHDGEELWDELVGVNGNFEMTFNGHYIGAADRQESVGVDGNTVHEMVHNRQLKDYGYLRLLEFLDDGKTIQVRTYCTNGTWLTDPANQFQIELSEVPEPAEVPELAEVPEPATMGLLALGSLGLLALGGLGLLARRRRRRLLAAREALNRKRGTAKGARTL